MKWFILLIIRTYWLLVPRSQRRKCIFKTSCSQYVYQEAKAKGGVSGWKALVHRYKSCRGGYMCYLNPVTGQIEMILLTGEILKENQMSDRFINRSN